MGIVRREGDWRLEKRGEGVYEITFRKEPQLKILTDGASTTRNVRPVFESLPVREVPSYAEVEGLFEEQTHGPPPVGMNSSMDPDRAGDWVPAQTTVGEEIDWEEIPRGGIGVAFLATGMIFLYTYGEIMNRILLLFALGFTGIGVLIFGYTGYLFRTEGWEEAWKFLVTTENQEDSAPDSVQDKTPPPPQSVKNELFFERANRHCEYCNEEIDRPEIHHITPRSEGGSNDPSNLIVLCPNCHSKADAGTISKSRLRYNI